MVPGANDGCLDNIELRKKRGLMRREISVAASKVFLALLATIRRLQECLIILDELYWITRHAPFLVRRHDGPNG